MSTLTATQVISSGTWQLDPVHSHVGFAIEYMAGTFHGTFAPFEATLDVGEDGTATLVGSARVESIQVQDENLGAHLASPEFFDAEQAPEISFASTAFVPAGETLSTSGKLTIKGSSLPVELNGTIGGPLLDPYGRERINLELQATIDRTAFGIDWNTPLPSGKPALADDVTITAELALVKQA